uniref:Uncharacterized protein n=1 Tax=Canis lupus familiaris TaxID=9615 RepID=A0A8I3PT91_CANLF
LHCKQPMQPCQPPNKCPAPKCPPKCSPKCTPVSSCCRVGFLGCCCCSAPGVEASMCLHLRLHAASSSGGGSGCVGQQSVVWMGCCSKRTLSCCCFFLFLFCLLFSLFVCTV